MTLTKAQTEYIISALIGAEVALRCSVRSCIDRGYVDIAELDTVNLVRVCKAQALVLGVAKYTPCMEDEDA
jgi:hypothetical protein